MRAESDFRVTDQCRSPPLRSAIRGTRSRHEQLPAAHRAAGRRRLSRCRRLFPHRPAGRRAVGNRRPIRAAAMERTLDALRVCAAKISARRVAAARYVATEACRRAANCEDFLARVEAEVGLEIEIISTAEEARLVVAGCGPLLHPRIPYAIVFDIGGGSTEVVWLRLSARTRRAAGVPDPRLGLPALRRGHPDRSVRRRRRCRPRPTARWSPRRRPLWRLSSAPIVSVAMSMPVECRCWAARAR